MNIEKVLIDKKGNNANCVFCTDLLSSEFSQAIQKAFETETRKKNVVNVTRAYYVFIDLKAGISLDRIEKYRLESFHSFLCAYIAINKSDKFSLQLWELCDNELSKISA